MNETPTPRTDAETMRDEMEHCDTDIYIGPSTYIPADFARTLERELTAANQRIAELEKDKARLDWLDKRTAHIYDHFKYHQSTAATQVTWRAAIDQAMSAKPQ